MCAGVVAPLFCELPPLIQLSGAIASRDADAFVHTRALKKKKKILNLLAGKARGRRRQCDTHLASRSHRTHREPGEIFFFIPFRIFLSFADNRAWKCVHAPTHTYTRARVRSRASQAMLCCVSGFGV